MAKVCTTSADTSTIDRDESPHARYDEPIPTATLDTAAAVLARASDPLLLDAVDRRDILQAAQVLLTVAVSLSSDLTQARKDRDRYIKVLCHVAASQPTSSREGHVYFMQSPVGERLIKIGFSIYPKGRLRALCAAGGQSLTLLHTMRGTKQDESELHRKFRAMRGIGEWFRPGRALVEHIRHLAPDAPMADPLEVFPAFVGNSNAKRTSA